MSFFSKLKNRLFKSSSKLDEGLDAIIEDGGEEVVEDTLDVAPVVPDALAEPEPEPEPDDRCSRRRLTPLRTSIGRCEFPIICLNSWYTGTLRRM